MYLWAFLLLATATSSVYSMNVQTCGCGHNKEAQDILGNLLENMKPSIPDINLATATATLLGLLNFVGIQVSTPSISECKTSEGADGMAFRIGVQFGLGCNGIQNMQVKITVTGVVNWKWSPDNIPQQNIIDGSLQVTVTANDNNLSIGQKTLVKSVTDHLKFWMTDCTRALITHLNFVSRLFFQPFPCCGQKCVLEITKLQKIQGGDTLAISSLKVDGQPIDTDNSNPETSVGSLSTLTDKLALFTVSDTTLGSLVEAACRKKTVTIVVPTGTPVGDWPNNVGNLVITVGFGKKVSSNIKTGGAAVELEAGVSLTSNGEEVLGVSANVKLDSTIATSPTDYCGMDLSKPASISINVKVETAKSTCNCKDTAVKQIIAILNTHFESACGAVRCALTELFPLQPFGVSKSPGAPGSQCSCKPNERKVECYIPKSN